MRTTSGCWVLFNKKANEIMNARNIMRRLNGVVELISEPAIEACDDGEGVNGSHEP